MKFWETPEEVRVGLQLSKLWDKYEDISSNVNKITILKQTKISIQGKDKENELILNNKSNYNEKNQRKKIGASW